MGRWKGNFGGGRVELTKELNWEKNRTEPKIEVQRIEETPPRVGCRREVAVQKRRHCQRSVLCIPSTQCGAGQFLEGEH